MKNQKLNSKANKTTLKNNERDKHSQGKSSTHKVKYNHKNYWLEEEMEEDISFKIKKKKKSD